jgi:CheY-like chemotaxis protein
MKKILIVEDDVYVGRMFGRAFRLGGYETDFASDGAIALKMLLENPVFPHAVIMDANMPNMGGYELLQKMKAEPKLKDITTVILTNSLLEETEKKFMSLHADRYLIKIDHPSKEVVSIVDELLLKKGIPNT